MNYIERIEAARKVGVWLEIFTTGFDQPKAREGYAAKAWWDGGSTLLHTGYTLEEAVIKALDDSDLQRKSGRAD